MQKTSDDIIVFLAVTAALILLMGSFIITIVFLYKKRQIAYFKELEQIRSDYEKNVLRNQVEIQEQTFQSIAREIHDNITLSLTLAKLNLNTLDLSDRQRSPERVSASIDFINKAISDLSDISRSLNSDIIHEEGLIKAIELEIEKVKKLTSFSVQFTLDGNPVFMEGQKEVFIFRIIQESFNNILKHAQARTIRLEMHYNEQRVEINITDDGVGFTPGNTEKSLAVANTSSGLRNMRKRAELLNGTFHITSQQGLGTVINITIPY